MKFPYLLLPLIALTGVTSLSSFAADTSGTLRQAPLPRAGKASATLLWIADTRKMDAFLASFELADLHAGSYVHEVLPDTRNAWRDYALEAMLLARQGRDSEAAGRLAQMLKLAAVYRSFGGLENVVQGEEIRYRASVTAEKLGKTVTALIQSPYLEKDASDCLIAIEELVGGEKNRVTESCWRHLEMCAVESHARLASCDSGSIALRP